MSKSVTIIRGTVWSHRSITRDRNIVSGNVVAQPEPKHDHGHHHHSHHDESDDSAGEGPDEWDTVQEGRTFTRRCRTN